MEDAILVLRDTHPLLKFPERDPQPIQSYHSLIIGMKQKGLDVT